MNGGHEPDNPGQPTERAEPAVGAGPAAGAEAPGGAWAERLQKQREKIYDALIGGALLAVIGGWNEAVAKRVTGQPWYALFVVLPAAVVARALWRRHVHGDALRLTAGVLAFLAAYVVVFEVAGSSRLLDWQRTLVGFDDVRPRSRLGLGRLGDWRYRVFPRDPARGIVVVLMDPPGDWASGRAEMAQLVALAAHAHARAVGLDFFFPDTIETRADAMLCRAIRSAEAAGMPVFTSFGIRRVPVEGFAGAAGSETLEQQPLPLTLQACITRQRLGHPVVFQERDRRVRSLPLHFRGDTAQALPALSLRLARVAGGNRIHLPGTGLLQFIAPRSGLPVLRFADLHDRVGLLDGQLVLAGQVSHRDEFDTPYGVMSGVELHAAALHSLLTGRFVERAPWWLPAVVLLLVCYGLLVLARGGASLRAIAGVAGIVSLALAVAALAAAALWRVWIDTAYLLLGIWLLVALLASRELRRRSATHARATAADFAEGHA